MLKLRLRGKIMVAPGVVLCFLLLQTAVSIYALQHSQNAVQSIFNDRYRNLESVSEAYQSSLSIYASSYKILSWITAGFDSSRIDAAIKDAKESLTVAAEDSG